MGTPIVGAYSPAAAAAASASLAANPVTLRSSILLVALPYTYSIGDHVAVPFISSVVPEFEPEQLPLNDVCRWFGPAVNVTPPSGRKT
ncbi:hypothetical protein A4G26_04095 [Mycobacterium kansasii]|nr:hypothetical protein A4G26_04095 [Mycobacterium kansasii]